MKRSRLWLLLLLVLAAPLYLGLSSRTTTAPVTSYATKPSTALEQRIYKAVMEWHKDVGAPNSESPDVFLATHFTKSGDVVARSCGLFRTRHLVLASESEEAFEVEPAPKGRLTTAQMAQISKFIKALPPSRRPQQWRDLFVFTFLDGKQIRHTRLYNRSNLPLQVRAIYRITRAPLEATKL